MLKNENGKVLLPVSFIVPRKNQDVFQADLYPPTPGVDAALVTLAILQDKSHLDVNGVKESSLTK